MSRRAVEDHVVHDRRHLVLVLVQQHRAHLREQHDLQGHGIGEQKQVIR